MNKNKRFLSEEMEYVYLRIEDRGYVSIILFLCITIIVLILISTIVKYPEKLTGVVFITPVNQVNKIVSPNNGKIILIKNNHTIVDKNDVIGYIENPASYEDILKLENELYSSVPENSNLFIKKFENKFNFNLGEVQQHYNSFLFSLLKLENNIKVNIKRKEIENIKSKIERDLKKIEIDKNLLELSYSKRKIQNEIFKEDSLLYNEKVIIKEKYLESEMIFINSKEKELQLNSQILDFSNKVQENMDKINLLEKEEIKNFQEIEFEVNQKYFELITAIKFWKEKFLIIASINGRLEYSQPFFNKNYYVYKGMPLFNIMPENDSICAKSVLSANGYGKIKIYDTVLIKLNDYPYKEYGILKGVVSNKSIIYNDSIYFVDIKLINGLKTNYKYDLGFNYNMSGNAEFLLNKKSFLERIFSNILYVAKNE